MNSSKYEFRPNISQRSTIIASRSRSRSRVEGGDRGGGANTPRVRYAQPSKRSSISWVREKKEIQNQEIMKECTFKPTITNILLSSKSDNKSKHI
jgi:hypothetical protein